MTTYVCQELLNWIAGQVKDNEKYICMGSGSTATTVSDTDLEYPVSMEATGARVNKVYESGSVNDNSFFLQFRVLSTQPSGQPVTLNEIGTFFTEGDNDDMGMRFVLPTGETKDTTSEWILRVSGKIEEG